MAITAAQCRAARALLDWTQAALAAQAGVSPGTIRSFEAGHHSLHRATEAAIRDALQAAGIRFVAADATGGEGVRRAWAPSGPPGCPEDGAPL